MSFTGKKIVCKKLSSDFRDATEIISTTLDNVPSGHVILKSKYLGINASDINYTSGRYLPGVKLPFDCGFECVGTVVAANGTKYLKEEYGAFAEYVLAPENMCVKIPTPDTKFMTIFSAVTASIGLEQVGEMKKGETVLVTAAAGGTGQFAVQFAKLAGCHVIGTCSSPSKVEFLKSIGCDRVINYKSENLRAVLKKEYSRGIDVVYESVGGETFEICVSNLARFGRLIIVGMISQYQDQTAFAKGGSGLTIPLPGTLLTKSASVRGYFAPHYRQHIKKHTMQYLQLLSENKIHGHVDPSKFSGLDQVAAAVDYMYSGKNVGKVVVDLPEHSKL